MCDTNGRCGYPLYSDLTIKTGCAKLGHATICQQFTHYYHLPSTERAVVLLQKKANLPSVSRAGFYLSSSKRKFFVSILCDLDSLMNLPQVREGSFGRTHEKEASRWTAQKSHTVHVPCIYEKWWPGRIRWLWLPFPSWDGGRSRVRVRLK